MDGYYFNYYVMFNAEKKTESYSPIVFSKTKNHLKKGLHIVDSDLAQILPALRYCLHLPKNGLETIDLPISSIVKAYSTPHNIIIIPSYISSFETGQWGLPTPTLVICDETSLEKARNFATASGSSLGTVSIQELTSNLLESHWLLLTQLIQKSSLKISDPLRTNPRLLSESRRKALIPLSFISNQLKCTLLVEKELKKYQYSDEQRLAVTINTRSLVSTLHELEQEGKDEDQITGDEFQQKLAYHNAHSKIPVVITLPGTAAQLQPNGVRVKGPILEDINRNFIEILGLHRSAARSAFWLESDTLPISMFDELRQLENHFNEESIKQISNRFLLESMKRIGKKLATHFSDVGIQALSRASEITAFSDFPIGLAILPGQGDPLCCSIPITYNPLTPLTRNLQMKLVNKREHYIGKERGFKLVIAECVLPGDRIYKLSVEAWAKIREQLSGHENIEVIYKEIQSVDSLKGLLEEQFDADILVISAHGYYKQDITGLWIGNEIWLAAEDDVHVPPVVILSACHVAPRGVGAVTVNDLFLRAGARAVLGTLIPVNVRKNAILTGRLFTYLKEAVTSGGQFRTLSEAWQWVVASNAINEVLESSNGLKEWAITRKDGNISPIEEFMLHRSNGRLRSGHVYEDTITVLQEIAKPDGLDVEAVISSQGFFPESCFYTWTGSPEEIILKEEVFVKAIQQGLLPGR